MRKQKVLLTLRGIMDKFGCGKTKAWQMTRLDGFPKPVVTSLYACKVWLEADVDDWAANLPIEEEVA